MNELPESCRAVQTFLQQHAPYAQVQIIPASTRTAQEAADALACHVAQIAKSIIFRAVESDRHVLVITCGDNRVSEQKVAALIGEKIAKADADFVRERTGFAIGGVSPFAHKTAPLVLLDQTLNRFEQMWAAAGTPNSLFAIRCEDLTTLSGGRVADIAQ